MGWSAFYTGIFGNTLATYAPIPAVIFSFSLLLSTPDPGPDCTWPGYSSWWAPTRASATRHRHPAGHTSTKIPAEIRKAMSVGLAVIAAGGTERRFFSYPSFAGGLGELRGARGWLTWRCWPENATPVVPCRPLSRPRLWAATAAVLAVILVWVNEKAIFCSDFSRVVFDGLL